jgi:hypothetical protein
MGHYDDLYAADEAARKKQHNNRRKAVINSLTAVLRDMKNLPATRETDNAITQLETALMWMERTV